MTTVTLSRRGLLASVPAIAATVAPVAATTLSGLPTATGDDPIFAAIERHRQAREAYKSSDEIFHRIANEKEASRNPDGVYLGEYPEIQYEFNGALVDGKPPISEIREVRTGRLVPRYATFPRMIDDSVPADCADPEAWKAQKHRELAEWFGVVEGSPRSVAFKAWNEAHKRLIMATAELGTRPATAAGVAALLSYIAEFHDDEVWTDCVYEGEDKLILDNTGLLPGIIKTAAQVIAAA